MKQTRLLALVLGCGLALSALPTPVGAFLFGKKEPPQSDPQAPVAQNMVLTTYTDVAITGYFDAVDHQGDPMTFQLTSTPARGAVEVATDGSGSFVYRPYEGKNGKDSFSYVAVDDQGHTSLPAKVEISIEKNTSGVFYGDLLDDPAHKGAIHLAEAGVWVGECLGGAYLYHPEETMTRAEFLALAMKVAGLEPLEGVSLTGFADDGSIPTWAKGTISAALQAGAIQGSRDAVGAPIFQADQQICQGEATAMMNRLLNLADVPLEVFGSDGTQGHWASQAAANLSACGVTLPDAPLGDELTRADAALILDGALTVMEQRNEGFDFFGLI